MPLGRVASLSRHWVKGARRLFTPLPPGRPDFLPAPAFALRLAMGELADIALHSQT